MRWATAALFYLACSAALAAPVEGKDYFKLTPAQPTSDATKIVVTEFFSYNCPHCFSFAKPFAAWSGTVPSDVKVERVAVSIGHESWLAAVRAYYSLSAMKAVPAIDDALFSAIHQKGARLVDEGSYARWVATQGLDQAEFTKHYRSFSVNLQANRADQQSRAHRIPSVPTLVIDGRYMVPIEDNGRFDVQLAVVNSLIGQARSERQ